MIRSLTIWSLLVAVPTCGADTRAEEHWPRFRGPRADGVAADDRRLPTTWSNTDAVQWVVDVPGWGWACPVIWGDHVFLSTVVSDEQNEQPKPGLYQGFGVRTPAEGIHHWMVYCYDLTSGRERWNAEVHTGRPQIPRHPKSTYASETPTTDGQRLYVLFGDVGLYCFDFDGNRLWSQEIEPQPTFFDYGAAASPVVHDSQVIVLYDNLEESFLACFDGETGQQRWRTKREEASTWATPLVWQNELRTEIVTCGRQKNRSYDMSGNLLWEFDGRMSNLVIPTPFAANGLLYLTSGYVGDKHRPVFAIRPGAAGDISLDEEATSNEFIAWYKPQAGPYNPSPIVYGDYYYTLFDRGFLTCHDSRCGEEVYGKQRFAPGASFTASPWAYNNRLFFLSEAGDTYVVEAGPEFKLLETNSLNELCLSTPAISRGRLLIRTASKLYCLSNAPVGRTDDIAGEVSAPDAPISSEDR